MYISKIIYLYWIYAANIWRTYVSRIYTLLQGPSVRGLTVHFFQGGQLGTGAHLSAGPTVQGPTVRGSNCLGAQLSTQLSTPKKWTIGPRRPTVRGPNVRGLICLEPSCPSFSIYFWVVTKGKFCNCVYCEVIMML